MKLRRLLEEKKDYCWHLAHNTTVNDDPIEIDDLWRMIEERQHPGFNLETEVLLEGPAVIALKNGAPLLVCAVIHDQSRDMMVTIVECNTAFATRQP